jgi:hypothetical protein
MDEKIQDWSEFNTWSDVARASHSTLFRGGKADVVYDRSRSDLPRPNMEALYTQSNARVLLGHAANGMLRFVALPTQVYPAPTDTREFELYAGMYHHFDAAMYVGDLTYRLELEGRDEPIWIASATDPAAGLDCETVYGADWLPLSSAQVGDLRVTLVSFAPVGADVESAPLFPAPLPGPAGAIYALHLHNTGDAPIHGKVVLQASGMLLGHYEDAHPDRRSFQTSDISLRQQTLILSRPYGVVGVHLHNGIWRTPFVGGESPTFHSEIDLSLNPGEERVFETHVAIGAAYADIMPTIYDLHMRTALDWLNLTAAFWADRLGRLTVDAWEARDEATWVRDTYVRNLLDNFNCLQTDADGTLLAHWQGAPSHGYGTVWGIDVEPTAISVVHVCPEITWAALCFFINRSRAPIGPADHSIPILVAPIVIARQWLQVTGDVVQLRDNPTVMVALRSIINDLMALKADDHMLFPSRFSSDGPVGRRYDYGTNVKVWYALDSMAMLARVLGDTEDAEGYRQVADAIREAIGALMIGSGPFGPQVTGGTNLGQEPGAFYLPEDVTYYDGEDTSSMLAPIYGMSGFTDEAWVNYHRWARSIWCPNFDPEFGGLRWSPRGPLDGTGFFSRLGGSVTLSEMREAVRTTWHVVTDDVTGSVFWWPHGLENKRSLTRCSQGQGAWAWQVLKQWLGLEIDANDQTLTLAPRGLLTDIGWEGFRAGQHRFDILWHEPAEVGKTTATVTNHNTTPWTLKVGFRLPGSGATDTLAWQTQILEPGETSLLQQASDTTSHALPESYDEGTMVALETKDEGRDGILIKRFGPAQLWGLWDLDKPWNPQEMPLTIRLLIENGTLSDWESVLVRLVCPTGWTAKGRQPRHWTRPESPSREAELGLGPTSARSRTVAPFWVLWPDDVALALSRREGLEVPFHATTQSGPGLTLYATNIDKALEVTFVATVRMTPAEGGDVIERVNEIPVRVLPR